MKHRSVEQFLEAFAAVAELPIKQDWIVLGDGSICVRDRVSADPINWLAMHLEPWFSDAQWQTDEDGEQARAILNMTPTAFERVANACCGECSRNNKVRQRLLAILELED